MAGATVLNNEAPMQGWKYPLTALPALAVPIAVYAFAAALTGERPFGETLAETALSFPMPVGVRWDISWADGFAFAGLSCLFADLLKSTSTGGAAVVNHMLSMTLLIVCVLLFLFGAAFVTSTFFMLMAMTGLDIIAGFTITTISARRDVATETS